MSDIGGVKAALNVQLTLKCASDIMPSTKKEENKSCQIALGIPLEKKEKRLTLSLCWGFCLVFS